MRVVYKPITSNNTLHSDTSVHYTSLYEAKH